MTTAPASLPLIERARLLAGDIKLAHSVFALPFALFGAFLAADRIGPRFALQLALVVACMITARTWAMLANRLLDAPLDALNPRTARRVLASGRVPRSSARAAAIASAAVFGVACSLFWFFFANPWPAMLAFPVLAWIALYSLTKRFTALSHFFLGSSLALAPVAAAIAVRPESLAQTLAIWLVAGMVLLWVAGFDIIYAIQDMAFDRAHALRSIPAALGRNGAARVSRILHASAAGALVFAWLSEPRLDRLFGIALIPVILLLAGEHVVLARRGNAGLQMAFFTFNGIVSCILGGAGCLDTVL